MFRRGVQFLYVFQRQIANLSFPVCRAINSGVVHDDWDAIFGEIHIEFNNEGAVRAGISERS